MIKFQLLGLRNVTRRIAAKQRHFRQAMYDFVKSGTQLVFEKADLYCSLTCHTLEELHRMGHPYKYRDIHALGQPHLIHEQTGLLRKNLGKWFIKHDSKFEGRVGYSAAAEAKVTNEVGGSYVRWVIGGTPKMIGRDFLSFALYIGARKGLAALAKSEFRGALEQ